MRLKYLFFIPIIAVGVISCKKNNDVKDSANTDVQTQEMEFTTVGKVKTTLGPGDVTLWSEGDAIKIFSEVQQSGSENFPIVSGAGTSFAKFKGNLAPASTYYAIYPASFGQSLSGSEISFELPDVQTYKKGSFATNTMPVVAATTTNELDFKNTLGVLVFQLKGTGAVSKIELQDNEGKMLSGVFKTNATSDTPSAVYVSGGSETLTLNCLEPVALSSENIAEFYFCVPVGSGTKGFTAIVYNSDATQQFNIVVAPSAERENGIKRSVIQMIPERVVSFYTEDDMIKEYKAGEAKCERCEGGDMTNYSFTGQDRRWIITLGEKTCWTWAAQFYLEPKHNVALRIGESYNLSFKMQANNDFNNVTVKMCPKNDHTVQFFQEVIDLKKDQPFYFSRSNLVTPEFCNLDDMVLFFDFGNNEPGAIIIDDIKISNDYYVTKCATFSHSWSAVQPNWVPKLEEGKDYVFEVSDDGSGVYLTTPATNGQWQAQYALNINNLNIVSGKNYILVMSMSQNAEKMNMTVKFHITGEPGFTFWDNALVNQFKYNTTTSDMGDYQLFSFRFNGSDFLSGGQLLFDFGNTYDTDLKVSIWNLAIYEIK